MKEAQLLSVVASSCSALVLLACVTFVPVLYRSIAELHDTIMLDMDEFKVLTDDIWTNVHPRVQSDLSWLSKYPEMRRAKRQSYGTCQCNAQNSCPAGPSGPPGESGMDGMPGENGLSGKPGADGTTPPVTSGPGGCKECPIGPSGPPGGRGPAGPDGSKGPNGQPGASGATVGEPGPQGPPGASGEKGADGIPGPAGPPGANAQLRRNTKGSTGPPGGEGPSGLKGPPGSDWKLPPTAGEPGPSGPPGQPGSAGQPGPQGPIGVPGDPGNDAGYCPCPSRVSQTLRRSARFI